MGATPAKYRGNPFFGKHPAVPSPAAVRDPPLRCHSPPPGPLFSASSAWAGLLFCPSCYGLLLLRILPALFQCIRLFNRLLQLLFHYGEVLKHLLNLLVIRQYFIPFLPQRAPLHRAFLLGDRLLYDTSLGRVLLPHPSFSREKTSANTVKDIILAANDVLIQRKRTARRPSFRRTFNV